MDGVDVSCKGSIAFWQSTFAFLQLTTVAILQRLSVAILQTVEALCYSFGQLSLHIRKGLPFQ
jgi:hypothetical protein